MRWLLPAVSVVWLSTSAGCRRSMSPGEEASGAGPRRDWARAISLVVTEEGYVDYDLLEQERGALDRYVAWSANEESWGGRTTRDWHSRYLNLYNALVMYQVLERGRPGSVLDPRRLLPIEGAAFFLETQFKVGPDWLSLSEIEHERVRQKELDYRDHAALNCASRSCPPLRPELYKSRPIDLNAQLNDQMTRWVMDDRGLRIEGDRVIFNPIFEWYERDFYFFSAGRGLCSIAADHATGARQKKLRELASRGCPHDFFVYDWSLNHEPRLP
ncbi:MAG TPA: DUF547 domain-containing protein [Deltaproteobacteria bacterium]|nr:DUF547 domain-containing protein [Deltaproteobacteria bacterium]